MWTRHDIQLPDTVEISNARIALRTALKYIAVTFGQTTGWDSGLVHEFADNKLIALLTHENGTQIALGCSLDGKLCHADNEADETLEGYLHCCFKPSSGGDTLSLEDGNPFDTSTWCADAGAYKFAKLSLTKMLGAKRTLSISTDNDSGSVLMLSVIGDELFDTAVLMLDDSVGATNFSSMVDGDDTEKSAFIVAPASIAQDLGSLIPPNTKVRHKTSVGVLTDGTPYIGTDHTTVDWDEGDPDIIDLDLVGKGTLDGDIAFVTSVYAPKNTVIMDGILHLRRGLCLRIGVKSTDSYARPLLGVR